MSITFETYFKWNDKTQLVIKEVLPHPTLIKVNLRSICNAHFHTFFTYVKRIRFSVRKRTKIDTQILHVLFAHSIRNFRDPVQNSECTKSQTDKIPNEQNSELDKIPNEQNPEWKKSRSTKSRVGQKAELNKIPIGQNPESSQLQR